MGYTNAEGTQRQMLNHITDSASTMVLHGGDISYADDLYAVRPLPRCHPLIVAVSSALLPVPHTTRLYRSTLRLSPSVTTGRPVPCRVESTSSATTFRCRRASLRRKEVLEAGT